MISISKKVDKAIKEDNSKVISKLIEKISLNEMSIKSIFDEIKYYKSDDYKVTEKIYKDIKSAYDIYLLIGSRPRKKETFKEFVNSLIIDKNSIYYAKYNALSSDDKKTFNIIVEKMLNFVEKI